MPSGNTPASSCQLIALKLQARESCLCLFLLCCLLSGCSTGTVPPPWIPQPWSDPFAALDKGRLVVWIVVPHGNPFASEKSRLPAAKRAQSKEQTAGDFGVSTTQLPAAARAANRPHADDTEPVELQHDPQFDLLDSRFTRAFPDLDVDFEDISEDDLNAELRNAYSTPGAPDAPQVLLGNPLPGTFRNVEFTEYDVPQLEAQTLTPPRFVPQMNLPGWKTEADRDRAQAFVLWVLQGGTIAYDAQSQLSDAASAVAVRAFHNLLAGKTLGEDADPELLGRLPTAALPQFQPALVRNPATGQWTRPVAPPPPAPEVEVVAADATWQSAVVLLRAISFAPGRPLTIRHAMFILRADPAGRMRVLHITLDLAPPTPKSGTGPLQQGGDGRIHRLPQRGHAPARHPAGSAGRRSQGLLPARSLVGQPWRRNPSGRRVAEQRLRPNLFFVPDSANRVKLQIPALFAARPGVYRWRVWSVGADGTIVLSNWRTLTIAT